MINDVLVTPLQQFKDERGKVMHMLRSTDPHFKQFGEVYFSWIYPNVIKAWSRHNLMTLNYAVPVGNILVVLYDGREHSPTYKEINEFYMNAEEYYLLTIPNGIWYGFKSVNQSPAMIVNCANMAHDPHEISRIAYDDPSIAYKWK